jgi:hypothetical protein
VPGKPDDPHIQAEILAAELGADAQVSRGLQKFLFQVRVPECPAPGVTFHREVVQVPSGGKFQRLQIGLRGGTPYDEGQVVGGTRGRPQGLHLAGEEGD